MLRILYKRVHFAWYFTTFVLWISYAPIKLFAVAESCSGNNTGDNASVFLTVSSLASISGGKITERQIELNWHNISAELVNDNKSWIGLFYTDPCKSIGDPLVRIKPENYLEGYFRTNIIFPRKEFEENELLDHCLGFWIAFIQNEKVLDVSCLRARPRWMEQLRNTIGSKRLNEIMIPGSHESGAYSNFSRISNKLNNGFIYTQEETVWNQLVYGIRYLEIRVTYLPLKKQLWINHNKVLHPLVDVLRQVKRFMKATNEIVFLDFQEVKNRFGVFNKLKPHIELVNLLNKELGDFMLPNTNRSLKTFNELWESGKRLFVGYKFDKRNSLSFLLNQEVEHLCENSNMVENLEKCFEKVICNPRTYLYSAMAVITHPKRKVRKDGLRAIAQSINSKVTMWFRDRWSRCANIIATDYFLGNNIINVAIETNKKK